MRTMYDAKRLICCSMLARALRMNSLLTESHVKCMHIFKDTALKGWITILMPEAQDL